MHLDFSFWMVVATLVTGGIWGGYVLLLRAGVFKPAPVLNGEISEPLLVDYARSFFPVILIVLVLRSFLVEPFRIPSGSMMPTLLIGDFILVNKYAYGIRLPVLRNKIFAVGEPQRGDIVVFRYPKDPSMDYIKRVIGLPGDRISYINKQLYVNGQPIAATLLGHYTGAGKESFITGALLLEEDLSGVRHDILMREEQPSVTMDAVVPSGHYFVMGDNRDNSNDSRYWGTVPEENLVGRAFLIWMNWDWDKPGIAFERLGNSLH
ncbi:MAG: signal peptidase I [Methylococcaceae bacterium]|nr:MAG: signal peptidase I [Methylococcaceae bacterium]